MMEVWPVETLPIALLDDSGENPNEMTDDQFSALVDEIVENGFTVPVQVIGPYENGRYKLYGGHHRKKAAIVLGSEDIPAVVVPPDRYDEDLRQIQLVKQNTLSGQLNPEKFTRLYNDLARKYDPILLQRMMGFTKEDAFEKVYQDARKALPPGMQEKLDEVRDELKTVDDLSLVLNRLFTTYGETVQYHFMFLSYGGREHAMIRLTDPAMWARVKKFLSWCSEEQREADVELMARMQWPN